MHLYYICIYIGLYIYLLCFLLFPAIFEDDETVEALGVVVYSMSPDLGEVTLPRLWQL